MHAMPTNQANPTRFRGGSAAVVRQLRSPADVADALARSASRPLVIFKHSTRCGISAAAERQWQAFRGAPEAQRVDLAWVRVIEERSASDEVARRTRVVHQSPQAILVRGGGAVWHLSGSAITADALVAAVRRHA